MRIHDLAQARHRFGHLRLHILLRREGWVVNLKRMNRIHREEGRTVRLRRRRNQASHLPLVPSQPMKVNEMWSMDFVYETLAGSRRFRAPHGRGYSRQSRLIEFDFTLTGTKVVAGLQFVAKRSGYQQMVTVDNGS
jgi:putative transposase